MPKSVIMYGTILALVVAPAFVFAEEAPSVAPAESSAVQSAPAVSSVETSAGSAPVTSSVDSSANVAPLTSDSTSSASGPTPSVGGSTSSAGSAPSSGGSTVSVGGGSSSSVSSGGSSSVGGTVLGASCPLITTFMKLGASNQASEVAKLQAFLKAQSFAVDVTGTFDVKTEDAVKAFQAKHVADTMGPWGASIPSGMVYITTLKKINQIACQSPLSLSASELAIIDSYKQGGLNSSDIGLGSSPSSVATTEGSQDNTVESSDNSNLAAAAGSSLLGRFWNFLVNLFR